MKRVDDLSLGKELSGREFLFIIVITTLFSFITIGILVQNFYVAPSLSPIRISGGSGIISSGGSDILGTLSSPLVTPFVISSLGYNVPGGAYNAGAVFLYSGGELLWTQVGENDEDWFGNGVSLLDDIDGDGQEDVAVTAYGYDGEAGTNVGKLYVYSGITGQLLWSVEGWDSEGSFGGDIEGVGDIDNDGINDIATGILSFPGGGKVTIYSGVDGQVIKHILPNDGGGWFGHQIENIGDINSDGSNEVVISALFHNTWSGKVYVYDIANEQFLWTVDAENPGDYFGQMLSSIEDINSDGFSDIVVGAPFNKGSAVYAGGKSYVYSGLTGVELQSFLGETWGDNYGSRLSRIGDVNNDGVNDYAVVATLFDGVEGENTGKIYIHSGTNGQVLWVKEGWRKDLRLGTALTGVGDYNGDGVDDIAVGIYVWPFIGEVYILSGVNGDVISIEYGENWFERFGSRMDGIPS